MKKISINDYVSTALILLCLVLIVGASNVLSRVDSLIFDIGQKLYLEPAPSDVVIVAIDENSLNLLGRWPWPRATHAQLIQQLQAANAAAIGLDIVFAEPDTHDAAGDIALADAIKQANNVVLPVLLESTRAKGQLIETLPLPMLANNAADLGRVHAALDEDGIARSIYLFEGIGAPVWQHFAQAVINVSQKKPSQNQFKLSSDINAKQLFSLVQSRQQYVNFLGPPGHFSTISYVQVLNGDFAKDAFRHKIVLVGATAAGMGDLLTTPVSGLSQPMAGVEFHANALQSIRDHRLIRPISKWWGILILSILTLMPLLWMPKFSALPGLILTLFYFMLICVTTALLPKLFGIWLPPAASLLPVLVAYPVWSWRKLEAAQQYLDQELTYLKQNLINLPNQTLTAIEQYDSFEARIEQVRSATEQLRYLQNDRKEMLAFISHDLRAPLARSLMMIEDKQQEKEKLRAPLSQALFLAEDFLQVSRAEMLTSQSFKELDFAGLAHQALDEVYDNARQKNISLNRDIVEGAAWVQGNFGLLQRAIVNLVLNAVKFSPVDSIVTVRLTVSNHNVTLNVIDNGPGIPVAEQKNLFKRFSRMTATDKTAAPEGAGLGLYFVQTVAEKHGGIVAVESDLGQPTNFSLSLPLAGFAPHQTPS
jgi:CHASE2 domain-containing sensor protein/nitrogen-specific signal transduction histidine kinase